MEEATGSQDPGTGSSDPGTNGEAVALQPITVNADMLGEYKDDPSFKPFDGKPIGEVLKSFKNAQQLIGGDKIVLPKGALDTEEVWNQVFDKLGRPKDVDGYVFDKPELPNGMQYDENLEKAFREHAHKNGFSAKQAAADYAFYNNIMIGAIKAQEEQQAKIAEETESSLMKELGTKEKYDDFIGMAKGVLNMANIAPEEKAAIIDRYGNDLVLMKALGYIGKTMSEAALLRGDKLFNIGADDGKKQLDGILYDKANPLNKAYFEKSHPQHQHAVDEVLRLRMEMGGDKPINMT